MSIDNPSLTPAWFPKPDDSEKTHIGQMMKRNRFSTYSDFHRWSHENYPIFWQQVIELLNIQFDTRYTDMVDLTQGVTNPKWFPNAKMNIVNSCFQNHDNTHINGLNKNTQLAIIQGDASGKIETYCYFELEKMTNIIAKLLSQQFKPGTRLAIIMPMDFMTVALYLASIKAGCVVVSIAESFSAEEMALRFNIAKVDAVFTVTHFYRDNKIIALYDKILKTGFSKIYILSDMLPIEKDIKSAHNLNENETVNFSALSAAPEDMIHILFSSGTTNVPKAIPWNHTTPIKCAMDAYFHHNLKPNQRFAWPSSLGWMMGPWLIFATLINRATMVLYQDSPLLPTFGEFIEKTETEILGVIPTIVKAWKTSQCMEKYNWQHIQLFTSTGECSNAEDMLYLMSLPKMKQISDQTAKVKLNIAYSSSPHAPLYVPVIEYCGGTEIGGAYVTGTLVQPQAPAAFSTPALGMNFVLLDEKGNLTQNGEVAIIPPSIGLSTTLLNNDHNKIYYENMPNYQQHTLRRHGDHLIQYANGFYKSLGRIDDTMNLGGIKISSAEIEQVLNKLPEIYETAAIASSPTKGGPSELLIYVVLKPNHLVIEADLKLALQHALREHLNPLFKIERVEVVDALLRTASNKIIRRIIPSK